MPTIPPDLVACILETLSARNLLCMRSTSKEFATIVDSILKSRLLKIANDETQELVFESSQPSEYRATKRLPISFTEFEEKDTILATDDALFRIGTGSELPASQFLPLDDEEMFGSYLLSVHIRGVETPEELNPDADVAPVLPTGRYYQPNRRPPPSVAFDPPGVGRSSIPAAPPRPSQARPMAFAAIGAAALPAVPVPGVAPRTRTLFSFSLSLAEGLERLFRNWFEDATLLKPTNVDATAPRRTRTQILTPSGGCAILEAHIECVQVAPLAVSADPLAAYRDTPVSDVPKLFEFHYTVLRLHVPKLIVKLEEALLTGLKGAEVVMYLTN